MDILTVQQTAVSFENTLITNLLLRIDEIAENPRTVDHITEAVEKEVPAEEIARFVHEVIQTARRSVMRVSHDTMRQFLSRNRPLAIASFDRTIILSATKGPEFGAVSAYRELGGGIWSNMPLMPFGEGHAVFTNSPGTYVFTGRSVNIPGLQYIPRGGAVPNIVGRFGLDDFLGRDPLPLNQPVTRSMVINSVARILGAPRNTDAIEFLRENNISVAFAGMHNPISVQETLHLMMLVYENRTGTRVDSLRITNLNAVNASQVEPRFLASVRGAVELNLVRDVQPAATLTNDMFLELLAALDALVGL
jgi:hypothetical protein